MNTIWTLYQYVGLAVFIVWSHKVFGSVVSGCNPKLCACMFPSLHISASPDDLSIFLPLYLSEWYKAPPCLMYMHKKLAS